MADTELLHARLDARMAQLLERRDAQSLAAARHWIEQLHQEDADSAFAVADRLDPLLDRVDGAGLGRWILGGLRRYALDLTRQRAFFRLEDRYAVEDLHAEAAALDLQQALPALTWLLTGLANRDMVVQPRHQAELNGPALRPVLTSTHLMLPDAYTALEGRDRFRLYCAATAHAVAHLRYSEPARSASGLKPLGIAVVSAIEDARVERLLVRDYPGIGRWFVDAMAAPAEPDDLTFAGLMSRMDWALRDVGYADTNHWVQKAKALFEAAQTEHGLEDYGAFRRTASVLANDLGQLRVRFNPQQYSVAQPYRDDHSFLWDFEPLKTPSTVAMELQARGRHAEAAGNGQPLEALETELGRYSHAEWDHRAGVLRDGWTTVIEKRPAWRQHGPEEGGARVARLPAARRWRRLSLAHRLRRQWEGEEIDLNAAIEVLVDRRLDLAPEARLFMRPGKSQPTSSLLALLDLSESANDRVGHTMRSILDVEKEAATMLAASATPVWERLAIHGFSSNTRKEVNYWRLLDFSDRPDDLSAMARVRSAQAALSTRLGAALRRATAHLVAETTVQKVLVVITDGAPSDVDVHDPDYLIEDARAAVVEAKRLGVQCYCVAMDAQADEYVRRIFGWRRYRIVEDPAALPKHLLDLRTRWSQG